MLTEEGLAGGDELDTNKLETTLLEAAKDGGDETTLDTIGLLNMKINVRIQMDVRWMLTFSIFK